MNKEEQQLKERIEQNIWKGIPPVPHYGDLPRSRYTRSGYWFRVFFFVFSLIVLIISVSGEAFYLLKAPPEAPKHDGKLAPCIVITVDSGTKSDCSKNDTRYVKAGQHFTISGSNWRVRQDNSEEKVIILPYQCILFFFCVLPQTSLSPTYQVDSTGSFGLSTSLSATQCGTYDVTASSSPGMLTFGQPGDATHLTLIVVC